MDEVRMVRDSYPEPVPPTAQEITRAKALLNRPPRRPLPRLRWGLGGLVAAGTAATVAIMLAGGNAPAPPGQLKLNDRQAFLVAAAKAEQQPIGRYWYVDMIQGQSYIMRPKTGAYAITGAHNETFSWWGAEPGMGAAFYGRDLPARPATARDTALWRRAGASASFRVWSGDHYYTYTTRATRWRANGPEAGTDPRGGGDFLNGKAAKDLQNLPADPAKLAEMYLSETQMSKAAGLPPGKKLQRMAPGAKIMRVASLLANPIPPKVRAGLMRALANQPGVHSIGRATDPLGRQGVALASGDRATTITGKFSAPKAEQGTYRSREVIIFDQRTGALLSEQEELSRPGGPYTQMKPGFVISYITTRSAWTDTKPNPPAGTSFS
jgi:hypothetical protein